MCQSVQHKRSAVSFLGIVVELNGTESLAMFLVTPELSHTMLPKEPVVAIVKRERFYAPITMLILRYMAVKDWLDK